MPGRERQLVNMPGLSSAGVTAECSSVLDSAALPGPQGRCQLLCSHPLYPLLACFHRPKAKQGLQARGVHVDLRSAAACSLQQV